MRDPFAPQLPLGATLMAQIQFDYGSRHEMVPILMTLAVFVSELQYLITG